MGIDNICMGVQVAQCQCRYERLSAGYQVSDNGLTGTIMTMYEVQEEGPGKGERFHRSALNRALILVASRLLRFTAAASSPGIACACQAEQSSDLPGFSGGRWRRCQVLLNTDTPVIHRPNGHSTARSLLHNCVIMEHPRPLVFARQS